MYQIYKIPALWFVTERNANDTMKRETPSGYTGELCNMLEKGMD